MRANRSFRFLLRWSLMGAVAAGVPQSIVAQLPADFVYASDREFFVAGEVDGDGQPDLIVVDRATGRVRVGFGDDKGVSWAEESYPAGNTPVEGFAFGHVVDEKAGTLLFASSGANRIYGLNAPERVFDTVLQPVPTSLIGPTEVASLPLEGSITLREDLFVLSRLADPLGKGKREFLEFIDGDFETLKTGDTEGFESAPRKVFLEGSTPFLGLLMEDGGKMSFVVRAANIEEGFPLVGDLSELPMGVQYLHASFDGSGVYQYVFWVPGGTSILVSPWEGSFVGPIELELKNPVGQLIPCTMEGKFGLFGIYPDGSGADLYFFDGYEGLEPIQSMAPPEGQVFTGALVPYEDGLSLFSGLPGGPTTGMQAFLFNGEAFEPWDSFVLPALNILPGGGSNVLLFVNEPFVDEQPVLRARYGSRAWTNAVSIGATVDTIAEDFLSPEEGLGDPSAVGFGSPPSGVNYGLGNQVAEDLALFSQAPAVGEIPLEVEAVPSPGAYAQAVTIELVPTDPGVPLAGLYYRFGGGAWQLYMGPIGPLFAETTLQWYGETSGGEYSPLRTGMYSFAAGPGDLDSDDDGVPDHVEVDAGLDPVLSGDDGDGDGYSDLVELLAGSDPNDETSVPPNRELDTDGDGASDLAERIAGTDEGDPFDYPANPVLNLETVFDLEVSPRSHTGSAVDPDPYARSIAVENEIPASEIWATTMRLYGMDGSLVDTDRTANQGSGAVPDPVALFPGVTVPEIALPMVVGTSPNFDLDLLVPDRRIGRQLAGLVLTPVIPELTLAYTYGDGGGDPVLEASMWLEAMRQALVATDRPSVAEDLDLVDTLTLLLFEAYFDQVANGRGWLIGGDWLTLTPFRASEGAVARADAPGDGTGLVSLARADWISLRHAMGGADQGFDLDFVFQTMVESVNAVSMDPLREVAEEIYRRSAAEANGTPGAFIPPLDALRQFIRTGSLDGTGFLSEPAVAPLDAATMSAAWAALGSVLALDLERPIETRLLEVGPGSLSSDCTVLDEVGSALPFALMDDFGNAFAFPDGIVVPVGATVEVTGYADVLSPCAPSALEVILPVNLMTLPAIGANDLDGNLLGDVWEGLFPDAVLDGLADTDGDGYSDLQEQFEGTDPTRATDFPDVAPVDLSPPSVEILEDVLGHLEFNFTFPAAYAHLLAFDLYQGATTYGGYATTGLSATHLGGGVFQLTVLMPTDSVYFYRFRMRLK